MLTPAAPLLALVAVQAGALLLLLARLSRGRHRRRPAAPREDGAPASVTVLLATLNEAARIGPCLAGLRRQGAALAEVLVVDSASTDGTRELVQAVVREDARFRLLDDGPLPDGWVGKVWALQQGLRAARTEWVLGIDADTEPHAGLVGGVLAAAEADGFDVVSFGPRFAAQSAGERWLQPALLLTLVYRFGPAGARAPDPDRVMANGQCFLARRALLERHGGYAPARASFCDDVTLARQLARHGARVGFLDGSRLITTRAYCSARETWREWGRSLDLKDASRPLRQLGDVLFLGLVQGLPVPVLVLLGARALAPSTALTPALMALTALMALGGVNLALLLVRVLMNVALRPSYERTGLAFWLSPLADPLAALRIALSSLRRPRAWRGRAYPPARPADGAVVER